MPGRQKKYEDIKYSNQRHFQDNIINNPEIIFIHIIYHNM